MIRCRKIVLIIMLILIVGQAVPNRIEAAYLPFVVETENGNTSFTKVKKLIVKGGTVTQDANGAVTFTTNGDIGIEGSIADHSLVRGDVGSQDIQGSGIILDDSNNLTGVNSLNINGTTGNTLIVNGDTLAVHAGNGNVGIGTIYANERLTVEGILSLDEQNAHPSTTAGYGKVYVKNGNNLFFKAPSGNVTNLLSGSGQWTNGGTFLHASNAPTAKDIVVGGNSIATADIILGANGYAIFNEAGADQDFRIEGDTIDNLIFVDASTNKVGIGDSSPVALLDIGGGTLGSNIDGTDDLLVKDDVQVNGDIYGTNSTLTGTVNGNAIVSDTLTVNNTVTLNSFTPGSIPFIGASGVLSEENSNLYYNSTNDDLVLGGTGSPQIVLSTNDGAVTINEAGNASDTRIEGSVNENMILVDGNNDRVGIGTGSPNEILTVEGVLSLDEQTDHPSTTAGYGKIYAKNGSGLYFKGGGGTITNLLSAGGAFTVESNVVKPNNTVTVATDDFVFGSNQLDDAADATKDARIIFDKSKAAFRAGIAEGTQWDESNRGKFSTALGKNNQATKIHAVAIGNGNTVQSFGGMALGSVNNVSGSFAIAIGDDIQASGKSSLAMGRFLGASGYNSFVIGTGDSQGSRLENSNNESLLIGFNSTSPIVAIDTNSFEVGGDLGSGDIFFNKKGKAVFNENANSVDFRVEGSSEENAFFVEGSTSNVGIGTNSPSDVFEVATGNIYVSSGNIGIGRQANNAALEVAGYAWTDHSGGAANPGFAFFDDSDTGVYGDGSDAVGFATGGSERLTVSSDGNVGIGQTSPSEKLHVSGNTYIESGNLGVGTQANNVALEVAGTARLNDGSTSTPAYSFLNNTDTGIYNNSGALGLVTGGSERLSIDTDGNTGLGMTSPNERLTVEGTLSMDEVSEPSQSSGYGKLWVNTTDSELYYRADDQSSVRITNNGSLASAGQWSNGGGFLYASNTPEAKDIIIGGIGAANGDIILGANGYAIFNETGADQDFRIEGDTNGNLFYVDASTDRVGLGTPSPAALLDVGGGTLVATDGTDDLLVKDDIEANGNIYGTTINGTTLVGDNLTINNNATIGNNLTVTATINGTTVIADNITVNDDLIVTDDINGADLFVDNATINNLLSVASFTATGTINGATLVGDNLTINNNATIGNNLTVTATINGTTVIADDITVNDDLTVTDDINGADLFVDNATINDTLTVNNFTTDGTVNASTLIADNLTINNNGTFANNLTVTNTINGTTVIADDITVNDDLIVTDDINGADLFVDNATINDTLTANNFTTTGTINGSTLIGDNLTVNNDATVGNDLTVTNTINGTTVIADDITVNDDLTVTDDINGADLFVDNATVNSQVTFGNFTAGSIPYIGASGVLSQENSVLFYDDANDDIELGGSSTSQIILSANDGAVTINEQGNAVDFRVEGDTDINMIFGQGSSDNVGIGMNSPNEKLTVEGVLSLDEQAAHPATTAGYGKVYTKNGNTLYFKAPDGTITNLISAGGGGVFTRVANLIKPDVTQVTLSTDDFVFGSDQLDDAADATKDARIIFDKSKAAFRAGIAEGTQWDESNRGKFSTALGKNNQATKIHAVAIGNGNTVQSFGGMALGSVNNVSGSFAIAIGDDIQASGKSSLAMGRFLGASGYNSFVIGTGDSQGSRLENSNNESLLIGFNSTSPIVAIDTNSFEVGGDLDSGDIFFNKKGKAVFNENANSVDFRVETSGQANALYIEGANDRIGFGTGAPAAPVEFALGNIYVSTGNIGIGRQANNAALEVAGYAWTDHSGGAANPGFAFFDDSDTGVYGDGSDTVGFATGGSERLTVSSDGNVGIGQTSPSEKLHVSGNTYIESGNLGVGTQANNVALEVAGTARLNDGSTSTPAYSFLNNTDTGIYNNSGALGLVTGGSERLSIDTDGNTGLGMTSPNERLTVEGTLSMDEVSEPSQSSGYGKLWVNTTDSELYYRADDQNSVKITNNGSLAGVGQWSNGGGFLYASNTPEAKDIIVGGIGAANGDIILGANGYAIFNETGADQDFRIESENNGNLFYVDASTDRVGLGTPSPAALLDIGGGTLVATDGTDDLLVKDDIEANGNIYGTTINGTTVVADDINVNDDLVVTDDINGADLFVDNATINDTLTVNNFTTDGTVNASTLIADNLTINNNGSFANNLTVTNTINGTTVIADDITVNDDLIVTDDINGADLFVDNATINNLLSVASFTATGTINGATLVGDNLTINNNATIGNNLTVTATINGTTVIADDITVNDDLTVTDDINGADLFVDNATINDTLTVNNFTTDGTVNASTLIADNLTINNNGTFANNLTVTNTINGTTVIADDITVNDDLIVTDDINGADLFVDNATINDTLTANNFTTTGTINGSTLIGDNLTVNNDATVGNNLTVTATINGTTVIADDLTVNDDINGADLFVDNATVNNQITFGNFTAGSIPYIGASGVLSQENSVLFYDDANDDIELGGSSTSQIILSANDGAVTINEQGNAVDFRVEGDTDINMIFGQGSSDNVGIGMNSPNEKLTVEGVLSLDEQAAHPATTAGYGKVYTKNGNKLYFKAQDGTITNLLAGGGTGAFTVASNVVKPNVAQVTLSTDDFVFGSDQLDDAADATKDARIIFDKSKAAFRAGIAEGTQWDNDNRGKYSIALGKNNRADNIYDVAIGNGNTVQAAGGMALGSVNNVTGSFALAIGDGNSVSGKSSLALGRFLSTGSYNSFVIGTGQDTGNRLDNGNNNSLLIGFQSTSPIVAIDTNSFEVGGDLGSGDIFFNKKGKAVFNENANSVDFRVESSSDENAFFVEGSTSNVGIGSSTPNERLEIASGNIYVASGNIGIGRQANNAALEVAGYAWTDHSGGAANPGFAFFDDSDTGVYGDGSDAVGFATGGSERLTVSSDGNVGIGQTSPSEKLHVSGNTYIESGNLGVGTQANNVALEVAGTARLNDGSTSTPAYSFLGNTDTGMYNNSGALGLVTGGSERLSIDTDGNTGLGMTSPNERLTVEGTLSMDEVSEPSQSSGYGKLWVNTTDSELYYRADDQNSVKITNNGSLAGVGQWSNGGGFLYASNTPEAKDIIVGGIGAANGDIILGANGYAIFNETGADQDFRIESENNGNLFYVDASTDRVGLGTPSPAALLDIGGGTLVATDGTDDLLVKDDIEANGNIYGTTINGTTVVADDINVNDDLVVTDDINGADLFVDNATINDTLTVNNFTTDGTVNASTLIADNLTINNNGSFANNLTVTNTINGTTVIADDITVNDDLIVTDDINGADLFVDNATINNLLSVASFTATGTINGATLVGDNLTINNNATIGNNLTVTATINGTTVIADDITVNDDLTVTDDINGADLFVDNATINDTLTVNNFTTDGTVNASTLIADNLTINNNGTFANNLTVTNTINGTTVIADDITVNDDLIVTDDINGADLFVDNATINDTLTANNFTTTGTINGSTLIGDNLTVNNDATVGNNLTVTATINGTTVIADDITVNDDLTVIDDINGADLFVDNATVNNQITFGNFTQGSIPYIGASGVLSQENSVLFYDDANDDIELGGSSTSQIILSANDGAVTINEQGNAVDFRVEGDTDINMIFGQGSSDNVGIGMNSPNEKLTVEGVLSLDEQAAHPATTAGYGKVYTKNGNKLYFKAQDGTITNLLAGGGSGAFTRSGTLVRPNTSLVTVSTDDFVFGSDQLDDAADATKDARIIFDKSKAAFRAGIAEGTQWDNDNRGKYSIALGKNNRADNIYDVAIGNGNTVQAAGGMALGSVNNVTGSFALAIGDGNSVSGKSSLALGRFLSTGSYNSFVIGTGQDTGNRLDNGNNNSLLIGFQSTSPIVAIDTNSFEVGGDLGSGDIFFNKKGKAVFNENANSVDFRVESSSDENAFFVEGSTSNVGIGSSTPNERLEIASGNIYVASGNIGIGRQANNAALEVAGYAWTDHSGGAANPGFAFFDDSDTGVYGDGSDTVGFATGGSERLTVNSDGNVGIGQTSPSEKLHVSGNTYIESGNLGVGTQANNVALEVAGTARLNDGSTSTPAYSFLGNTDTGMYNNSGALGLVTGGSERLSIDTDGNTGLGMTSPNERLTVEGTLSMDEVSEPSQSSGYGKLWVNTTDSELYYRADDQNSVKITNNGSLAGVGQWSNGGGFLYASNTPEAKDIIVGGIGAANGDIILGANGYAIFNESGNDQDFRIEGDTNGNLFYVDASTDRVGVGTPTPSALLDVGGGTLSAIDGDNDLLVLDDIEANGDIYGSTINGTNLVGTTLSINTTAVINEQGGDNDFRVEGDSDINLIFSDASEDRVGIGLAAPSEKLTIEGVVAMDEVTEPSQTAGYGKLWINSDNSELYFRADDQSSVKLTNNGSVAVTTVAGNTTEIQFNNGGSLDASANLTFNGQVLTVNNSILFNDEHSHGSQSSSFTANFTEGNKQTVTLAGNITITLNAPGVGNFSIRLVQDGTGSRSVTWAASSGSIKWPSGTAPTLSTAASAEDIVTCYYNGTNYYCQAALDFQ